MPAIRVWLERLISCERSDPVETQRGRLLNVLLLGTLIAALLVTLSALVKFVYEGWNEPDLRLLLGGVLWLCMTALLFLVSKTLSSRAAAYAFLGQMVLAVLFSDTPTHVIAGRSTFAFVLPIILASALIGPAASFFFVGLVSVGLLVLSGMSDVGESLEPATIISFLIIALASWLMASGLNQSLYLQARQAEELRRINKELDRRVEQRTAELALANQRLTELDRLKSEFVAMAAHELRTPLTILMGFSELLVQRPALGEQERQRYTSFIHQHAVRLAAIVSNLLDLSRIESGHRDDLNRKPFNLLPLVEDMAASFRAQSANHTYRIKGSQAWPIVEGDQGELGQVVYNLLSNATKYSPGGGEVVIDGQPAGDYLQVSVQDCGIGISPEAQAHLFEPFYRADASNTSISGPGLGLVICKGIIDRHGGAIWVNSQPGVGTTVYFTVPLAAE